jgi:ketosteroid isomerase-like protein
MSWITENPWPLILILGGVAAVLQILGGSKGRSMALICVAAAVGLYVLESAIVTPGEEVEQNLQSMLKGFIDEDAKQINAHIADDVPELKDMAKRGLEMVQVHQGFHLREIVVTVSDDGQTAEAELRANGSLTVRQAQTPYHAATRWRTHWKRKGDSWKLMEVHRLNPVTGDEIGVLERQ